MAGLLKAMTLGRILFPSAKLALLDHARGTLLAAACGLDQATEDFDEDDLYAAMDQLNGHWVGIEKQLYQKSFPQGVSLVLYDLTSVYFEGNGPSRTSQYGHSRDHRSDRPQVLLAVATDAQGLPLHLEVLRGNRGDTTTQGLLSTLRRRFGIREAVFVFDGGMSKKVNPQKLASQVGRALQRLKADKYFDYAVDPNGQLQWSRRTEVIQAEKIRDGLYLLGTNATPEQIPSTGVLSHYKNLLEVEDAFCHLKDYLRVRPVFHWRPDRVRNHVRICFLAYWLSAKLERQWRQKEQTIEVHNLLRQLQAIRLGQLHVHGKPLKTMVAQVPKDLNAILNKLGLLPLFSQPPTWAPGVL